MIVIFGPTSSGKTSLAIKLCEKFGGEIISADSRQIYKFMDIGTGKLPLGKSKGKVEKGDCFWTIDDVRVWGYDLVTPDKYFSAYNYARFALGKIRDIRRRGKLPFLVGGTGFYIDVVTGKSKLSGTRPDMELRGVLESTSTESLLAKLKQLNPNRYGKVDKNNRRRIIRALEIEMKEERSVLKGFHYLKNEKPLYIGLTAPRGILYGRVDTWADLAWTSLIVETKRLIQGGYKDAPPMKSLIYKTAVGYIDGEIEEKGAVQRIKYDLHAYVRRQQTWFKRYANAHLFDITRRNLYKNVCDLVESY